MSSSTDSLTGFYGWTNTLKGVYYGPGSLKTALPKLLEKTGITKAMVITGRSLYTKSDVVKQVENVLKDHNAYTITFYEIGQHSPIGEIRRAIDLFKQHNCDGIVSVGGGSPVDASKAILYNIQKDTGGPTLHQIAIPTTLSAAEYSIGAGFTDDSGHKVAVSSQDLAPAGIVLDAELTLATPGRLWLSTGIRALDHAVENLYREVLPYPMRVLCYTAIADLFENLKLSKADPSNVAVRQKLQIASWMSLWPIKLEQYAPLGLSHSLGHKLGARYSIPHGITSCLTLAPTVALMASINTQENKENLAKALFYLQQPSTGNVDGDVKHLASLIDGLVKDLGLHSTLSEYKVPEADLSEIADKAIGSQSLRGEMLNAQVTELLRSIY